MPNFVRTKADEKRWARAKRAVASSRGKEEAGFDDRDWALTNHIFHTMSKSDKLSSILERLKKIDEELSKGNGDDEEADLESQGFRVFNPEDEQEPDDAEKWLSQNDPAAKKPEPSEEYEEYHPDEDDEAHMAEASQAVAPRYHQPTKEEIADLRQYTRPWEQRVRETTQLGAEASKNPVHHHEGHIVAAREKSHADKKRAYEEFTSSKEYQDADPISQMEMDAKFHENWNKKSPTHLHDAIKAHLEAEKRGQKGYAAHKETRQEQLAHLLGGGVGEGSDMSTEEAMQHVGGVKNDDEKTTASMFQDPAARFANANPEFIERYKKLVQQKMAGRKPAQPKEEAAVEDDGLRDKVRAMLGDHPALKDPAKRDKVNKFFEQYYPLIQSSAGRVLNRLGLDKKSAAVDTGAMHEAGMHGLFNAVNTYDHEHPSKASFSTFAGRKIRGMMQTALARQMDDVPAHIRDAAKKYAKAKTAPAKVEAKAEVPAAAPVEAKPVKEETKLLMPAQQRVSVLTQPSAHEAVAVSAHPQAAKMAERLASLPMKPRKD